MATNLCATKKRRQWPLRPNPALGDGPLSPGPVVPARRGLDLPASGGVASRLRTAMGGIHAQSGCHDRRVLGRLPGRTRRRLGGPPPQGYQSDAAFAASAAAKGVVNVSATTQRVSCYAPETLYLDALLPADGYLDGGGRRAPAPPRRARTSGRTHAGRRQPRAARQGPLGIGHARRPHQSQSPDRAEQVGVNAEGYNHLLGFYESFDGGATWPVQGHVPGYEGWTDNTDPVGAFDPWGNFYSLVLPYQFYYGNGGVHKFDNGSNQTNPTVPPEAIAVAVHPHATLPARRRRASWITTHDGHPDYLMTAKNANTNDPDKQWIAIDTNPASPHYGRVYAMWTLFVFNPSHHLRVARRRAARRDAHRLVRAAGPADGRRASAGTPTCCRTSRPMAPSGRPTTNNPPRQGLRRRRHQPHLVHDGGASWQGPLPVRQGHRRAHLPEHDLPGGHRQHFAVGPKKVNGRYPLYVSWEDGTSGLSNVYLTASYDGGTTWARRSRSTTTPAPWRLCSPTWTSRRTGRSSTRSTTGGWPARRRERRTRPAPASPTTRHGRVAGTRTTRELLRQHGGPVLQAQPRTHRAQRPALGPHLGPAALRAAPQLHLQPEHVHRGLLRRRLGRRLHLHHLGVDLQRGGREPVLPPATGRRTRRDALSPGLAPINATPVDSRRGIGLAVLPGVADRRSRLPHRVVLPREAVA